MPSFVARAALLACVGLGVGACQQSASSPAPNPALASTGVTSPGFRLPEASGCAGEVSRFRAVMDNDLATGHVGKSVHARATADIDRAAAACTAGRDAEAVRIIASTKGRFGYP